MVDEYRVKPSLAPRVRNPIGTDTDRLYDDIWNRIMTNFGLLPFSGGWSSAPSMPSTEGGLLRAAPADVVDTGKSYKVLAEIPGIPKERLDIRVRGNTLEIKGEGGTEKSSESGGYLRRERTYDGFYRTLSLPEPVLANEATARIKNGILELELPKEHPTTLSPEQKIQVE
jgi:HSP20 family protein